MSNRKREQECDKPFGIYKAHLYLLVKANYLGQDLDKARHAFSRYFSERVTKCLKLMLEATSVEMRGTSRCTKTLAKWRQTVPTLHPRSGLRDDGAVRWRY